MSENLIQDDYKIWIKDIVKEYRGLQIKAASSVNVTMLEFYYKLGRDIQLKIDENVYGSDFYNKVSKDLIHIIPDAHSFSVANIRYMARFYKMLHPQNLPQVVDKLHNNIIYAKITQNNVNLPQLVEESNTLEEMVKSLFVIFNIPWGHIRLIIDKYSSDLDRAVSKI